MKFSAKFVARTIFIIVSILFFVCNASNKESQAPNIIFILADDLGWDDVGFHGSEIETPHIDRLAKEGVILNNYYTQPVCTPTRSAILTGRYPIHTGLQHGVIHGAQAFGMPLNLTTLPQRLKSYGYQTHAIGKWHLGFLSEEYIPESRGFDSFFGYYNGREDYFDHHIHYNDFAGLDFHYKKQPLWNYSEAYSTDIFANQAKSIIETHDKSSPLFIYFAHQAVHAADYDNIQAPQKNIDRFKYITNMRRKYFAGAVSAIDDSIGVIQQSLMDAGMADNTIIVFSTDNGGPTNGREGNAACNWPLRGSKATLWQGGVHTVGFVHSPLLHTKGYVSESLIHASDWFPTLLSIASRQSSKTSTDFRMSVNDLDGIDQWDVLSMNKKTARKEILLNIDPIDHNEAIIVGDFKLIHGESARGLYDGWYPPPPHKKPSKTSDRYENEDKALSESSTVDSADGPDSEIGEERHENLNEMIKWMNRKYKELKQSSSSPFQKSVGSPLLFSSENDISEPQHEEDKTDSNFNGIVKVKCGPKPANATTNCKLKKNSCLFNIKEDPCEYMNLAVHLPEIVLKLSGRINFYRQGMVKPLNKPVDPRGNPALHGGVWRPWL